MKKNYHELLLEEIKSFDKKKTILLHSCCGPCSSYVIDFLATYFEITILYYNPNIEPYEEYLKRKKEQIRLLKELPYKVDFLDCDYENEKYLSKIKGLEEELEGGSRCIECFKLRLEKTAGLAKEKFDYFGTTLTVSPHKNATIINEIGEELSKQYNIKWLYADFKKNDGYKKSIEFSKQYNLYRQDYCGCHFSKRDKKLLTSEKIV